MVSGTVECMTDELLSRADDGGAGCRRAPDAGPTLRPDLSASIQAGSLRARTTSWAPEDAGIVKRTLARNWTSLAATRDRILRHRYAVPCAPE